MDKAEKDRLWAELDALGEDQVRENLGLSGYGRKGGSVQEWLRKKDQERSDERDRSNTAMTLANLNIARSAKNAAWTAAVAAIIAIIVSILIIYRPWFASWFAS